jgi:hypothetical protein
MSRRTARQVDEVLKTHVSLEGARIAFHAMCARARRKFSTFADRATARRVSSVSRRTTVEECCPPAEDGAPAPVTRFDP